jgi:hypothetical protein
MTKVVGIEGGLNRSTQRHGGVDRQEVTAALSEGEGNGGGGPVSCSIYEGRPLRPRRFCHP